MIRTNFHTHTLYCDGKNTPKQMIEAAIAGGFSALGFSGHSMVSADPDPCWCMSTQSEGEYRRELKALQEEYRDQIRIFCGIEQDLCSETDPKGYDFAIGSVHYVRKNDGIHIVDFSADRMKKTILEQYHGDAYAYAEDYFRDVAEICHKHWANIIGHFDLLTKFNEQKPIFDENHPRYIAAWQTALETLAESGKYMEINSGAIPRGYRTSCYPAPAILQRAAELKIPLLLTCDCHDASVLSSSWQLSYDYALSCGITETYLMDCQESFLESLL